MFKINTDNIFFTADYHIGHQNIIRHCNRPFTSTDEMKQIIISNHNAIVKNDNDIIFNLGDIAYRTSINELLEVLNALRGRIYFLWGNHDKVMQDALHKGFLDKFISSGKLTLLGHSYPEQSIITLEILGKIVNISHNALRTWNSVFYGAYHLFGHSHGNLPPLYKSCDVGIDIKDEYIKNHKAFTPFNFTEEIIPFMESITRKFKEE